MLDDTYILMLREDKKGAIYKLTDIDRDKPLLEFYKDFKLPYFRDVKECVILPVPAEENAGRRQNQSQQQYPCKTGMKFKAYH